MVPRESLMIKSAEMQSGLHPPEHQGGENGRGARNTGKDLFIKKIGHHMPST